MPRKADRRPRRSSKRRPRKTISTIVGEVRCGGKYAPVYSLSGQTGLWLKTRDGRFKRYNPDTHKVTIKVR